MKKTELFRKKLESFDKNYPFTLNDFNVKPENINSLMVFLHTEIKKGTVGRMMKGIYYQPIISQISGSILTPINYFVANKIIEKENGYLTGLSIFNLLELTTQFAAVIFYAANKAPKIFSIENQKVVRYRAYAPVTQYNTYLLQLLDCILHIEKIPDQDPDTAAKIIGNLIKRLDDQEIKEIEKLSSFYPPRVRALFGAIIEPLSPNTKQIADQIRSTLNPVSKYKMSRRLTLANKHKFNIYDRPLTSLERSIISPNHQRN